MILNTKSQARFEELIERAEKIKATHSSGDYGEHWVDSEQSRQWTMSVLAILKSTLGEESDNYKQVSKSLDMCAGYGDFCTILSYTKAALEDLKGGYFFHAKSLLEAEIFSDLLEQAEELLKAKYFHAAAVLVGAVLEKHMRSMCARRGISLMKPKGKHKMINDMNDELSKVGAYNALKKKQIIAWADLRNNAAHGVIDAYTVSDVAAFLRDVSDLCANVS